MDKDSAQDEANYEIKDKGYVEKTLTYNSCKLGDDMKTVTMTLDGTVEDCLTNSSTAKVILSKDVTAANGKKLGTDREVEVAVQDGILPTVKEVKAVGEKNIKIIFSEPVYEGNNNKTLNTLNFAVKSGTYTYYVQKATLNLNVINLEVGTRLIEGPATVTVNDAGIQAENAIQDYAGYKVFKVGHTFNYVKDTSVPVSVSIEEAHLIAKNEIKLLFNTKMESIYVTDIELATSTTSSSIKVLSCKSTTVNSYGKTETVLILDKDLPTDARDEQGNEIFITISDNPSSESESGSRLEPNFRKILDDKTPPEIVMWDHDDDESTGDIPKVVADIGSTGIIRLFFSEDIDYKNLSLSTFNVYGFKVNSITHDEPKTVTLEVEAEGNPPAKITVTRDLAIFDVAGNELTDDSTWVIMLDNTQSPTS